MFFSDINISVFLIVLILHVLGDFYFQTDKLAQKKENSFIGVLIHSSLYLLTMILIFFIIDASGLFMVFLILSIGHFIIDVLKYLITKYLFFNIPSTQKVFYFIDQFMHLIIIVIAVNHLDNISFIHSSFIDMKLEYLKIILLVLLMLKPANVTIKILYQDLKHAHLKEESSTLKAGRIIGYLERLLIVMLIYLDQLAGIGLVLTAKSIARYNKISEDQDFSEFYLIGTLSSLLYALGFTLLIMKI